VFDRGKKASTVLHMALLKKKEEGIAHGEKVLT
jgi:hypothetical protein